ncbi:MAG: cytochrome c biogenesis protein CcdA [Treponema sp.]|jgi:cytochrome c-type biogenesis protein|nr:cytochrome c biogenesis protein CcdA [Treponema sp.]
MTDNISILAAFIAGLLSFLSPCVLPLISSYLLFISGGKPDSTENTAYQAHLVGSTACFILGFTCVFIALSVLFSGIFFIIGEANVIINTAAGVLVIILGFNILFDFIPFLNYEKRIQPAQGAQNFLGSFLIGLAFGAGWTPCIGPILGSILLMAGQQGKLLAASGYLLVYSLGLGLPFLTAAVFWGTFLKYLEKLKPWRRFIHTISGVFIIGIGVFIMFGRFHQISAFFLRAGVALSDLADSGGAAVRVMPGILFFVIALTSLVYRMVKKVKLFSYGSLVFCGACLLLSIALITGLINWAAVLSSWMLLGSR